MNIAVLASGRGSNFQAIIDGIKDGRIKNSKIVVLITDNKEAKAVERAKANNIPVEFVDYREGREVAERRIKELLDRYKSDLVCLAGFMRIIKTKELLEGYRNKIINIHPALLPSFTGMHAQKKAFEHGVKVSGCTVHFVDESLDGGPIIDQACVYIGDCKSAEEVEERILKEEHKLYVKVVGMFAEGKFKIEGRRVIYQKAP
ncbi:MAG: phosphoribosylglycinamide formyltransferase [Candidatus Anstonellales archaeon]